MTIERLDNNELDLIEPLWEALKAHHQYNTVDFDDYYRQNTFAKRQAVLLSKEHLAVFVAKQTHTIVGFCVCSINHGFGEIDSLYVTPNARGNAYGDRLLEQALDWLKSQHPKAIRLSVGQGNEKVVGYYQRHGFKQRAIVMELIE